MAWEVLQALLVLFALEPLQTFAQVFPRQTTFDNTTTPTVPSSPASAAPTPPPCCWIVIGDFAVGYNNWYTTTVEHVVATIITTFTRENNGTAIPINSTTVYLPANATEYPTEGNYQAVGSLGPSVPGVPTTLLTGNYGGGMDYAATGIRNTTVVSFPHTDLVITQPTPYDVWMRMGIYTERPNATELPSDGIWPSSVCGMSSTYTLHSNWYSTSTVSGRESVKEVYTPTATLTTFVPWSTHLYYNIVGASHITELNVTYVQAKTSQFTEERMFLPLPTNIIDWLATQEEVIRKFPYIRNCYVGGAGVGQPTVHVPVNALTVTSSHFLDAKETAIAEPSEDKPTTIITTSFRATATTTTRETPKASTDDSLTVSVETSRSSAETKGTKSTASPRPEDEKSEPNPTGTLDAPVTRPETAERKPTSEIEESASAKSDAQKDSHTLQDQPKSTDHNEKSAGAVDLTEPANPSSTASQTAGVVGGLISAIRSVVDQQDEASNDSPSSKDSLQTAKVGLAAVTSIAVPEDQPAESVTGFAIGTQTASPGGDAVTQGGSIYSALPSGSGLRVAADSKTSTLSGAVIPAVAIAQSPDSDNEYVVGDNTLTAGGPAVTNDGSTYSALPSGSGLRVVADGQTSTLSGAVSPGVTIAQGSGSDNEYIVGDNTLTAGGPAVTSDGTTISALSGGSGVQVAASGQTSIVHVAASADSFTLRSGGSEGEYVFAGNTLSAGDNALTSAGVTYSAIPSGSGIIIVSEGSTSTASIGEEMQVSVTAGDDLGLPTPVILPAATAAQTTDTSSSTHGLGDAIMSGIGGGATGSDEDNNSPSSETTTVEAASSAGERAVYFLWSELAAFGLVMALM